MDIKIVSVPIQFDEASFVSPLSELLNSQAKKAMKKKKKKKPPKGPPEGPPMADPTPEERERRRQAIFLLDILPRFLDEGDERIEKAKKGGDDIRVLIERDMPPMPTDVEKRDLALAELLRLGIDVDAIRP